MIRIQRSHNSDEWQIAIMDRASQKYVAQAISTAALMAMDGEKTLSMVAGILEILQARLAAETHPLYPEA